MCTRGVKFLFEPGEYVLCFEPDPTKARVLYSAKILEQSVGNKDSKGKRRAEYLIHFQGWNSSWDRFVPDSFVLKNNDENRALMRRLAAVARKGNKSRKRRIDDILKKHFSRQNNDSETESTSTEEQDIDEDEGSDVEGSEDEDDQEDEEDDEEEDDDDTEESEAETQNGVTVSETGTEDETEEEEEEEEPQVIELDLPENLRHKLEDDCYTIKSQEKLLQLPATPNVITVLEGYVKNFAVNILCGTVEKQRQAREDNITPPDKSVDLCKEMVDGLRVFFDFSLPTILLYEVERLQHQQILEMKVLIKSPRKESTPPPPEAAASPTRSSPRGLCSSPRGQRRSSTRLQHTDSVANDPSPKIPRLSPKVKEENPLSDDDNLPPRRITRHAYQEEIKRSRTSSETVTRRTIKTEDDTEDDDDDDDPEVQFCIRGSSITNQAVQQRPSLSERVTPPPPLLIPSNLSSQDSSDSQHTPTGNSGFNYAGHFKAREAAVNNVFSWQLLPGSEAIKIVPSTVYGAHHLLRLLVKLPNLLSEMKIPEPNLKHLVRHLELFIDYMSDRCEELFPESAYIDAADAITAVTSDSN